jgi:hypothetical protein
VDVPLFIVHSSPRMKRMIAPVWLLLLQTLPLGPGPSALAQEFDISRIFSDSNLNESCLPTEPSTPSETPRCANDRQAFAPLSPLDEARTLIVGYHPDAEDFIADLGRAFIDEPQLSQQRLLVLVPQGGLTRISRVLTARPEIRRLKSQGRLDLRSTSDAKNTWLQDAMEIGWDPSTLQPKILDLPHFESDRAAQSLAASCGLPTLNPERESGNGEFTWNEASKGDPRNHGGNWEAFPGGILATLREPESNLRNTFERHSPESEILSLTVDWLEVGHIDEVFGVLPLPESRGSKGCNFALTAASPARAIETLLSTHEDSPLEPELTHAPPKKAPPSGAGLGCISRLSDARSGAVLRAREARQCNKLIEANREFERLINEQLSILLERVQVRTGCQNTPVLRLPTLFRPAHRMSDTSWQRARTLKTPPTTRWRQARSINPNPINGISLNSVQFVPAQAHPGFRAAIESEMQTQAHGVTLRWIDTPHVHFLGGEAHCGTNVIRTCTAEL